MYYPNYMDLPKDIYSRMVHLAESYDVLRKRRQEIENEILYAHSSLQFIARGSGVSDPTGHKAEKLILRKKEVERKISAIEQAWESFDTPMHREVIRKNLFEGVPMEQINLPCSVRTMKRIRKRFLTALAENLNEI